MLRFFLTFLLILICLAGFWWFLKNRRIPWVKSLSKELKHIEGLYLGMNISLHVVKYKGRYLLIGCSPGNIVLLKEFEDENQLKEDN
ncbi:MAG: flagellar biosynthetic protein FliO [bacterium]|nr:flagellar biosynthetic protein FliO [bacterium]